MAAAVLLAGLAAAPVIFLTAAPTDDRLDERPEDSKQYLRQMEVYGGTANVLASEIREWFYGLWRGRTLAFTVAGLSLLLALVVFVGLTPLPPAVDRHGADGGANEPDS